MNVIDFLPLLQYPGMVCTVAGYYMVGSRNATGRELGFKIGICGNVIWGIYALWGCNPIGYGIFITNVCIFVGGIRGMINNSEKIDTEELDYMRKNGMI